MRTGCGSLTYPHGIAKAAGVQTRLSCQKLVDYVERGKAAPSPYKRQVNRKAYCWRGGSKRLEKANALAVTAGIGHETWSGSKGQDVPIRLEGSADVQQVFYRERV